MIQPNKKIIYDLLEIGYTVVYLPDYGWYLLYQSGTFYNPSNHIHTSSITGKDVTELIDNFSSNFQDQKTTHTGINKVPDRTYTFDKDTNFIWFKK
jgi:hypothetical protein